MAARGTGEGGDPTAALLAALRQLLRPIARLVIERQITFPMLADLLKVVLIEVARDEFALRGKRLTDSRLSLLTGIHRKDVKRLRSELDREVGPSRNASLGALLVSRWVADPTYLDEQGEPRPLPRAASAGPGPSFEQLVLSVSKDIPVRSVLDEWVRQGIVEHDASDVVRLRVESFVAEEGFEDKAWFFGRNLRDHAAAGVHNLLREGEPFFDRSVFYDRLSAESIEELRRAASEVGARSLREMNRRALALQRRDESRPAAEASRRMTWGAFFFGAPYERDEETSQDRTPTTDANADPVGGATSAVSGESDEA